VATVAGSRQRERPPKGPAESLGQEVDSSWSTLPAFVEEREMNSEHERCQANDSECSDRSPDLSRSSRDAAEQCNVMQRA